MVFYTQKKQIGFLFKRQILLFSIMEDAITIRWKKLITTLTHRFNDKVDMQSIIFMIGVQEVGKLKKKFTKDQKIEIMHVAICKLLSNYGYYEFIGSDKEGWPHWKLKEKMPHLTPFEQEQLMKEAILEYFNYLK